MLFPRASNHLRTACVAATRWIQAAEHLAVALDAITLCMSNAEHVTCYNCRVTYVTAHLQVGAGGLSRLITWQGSDRSLQPVLFVSHVDVVPVAEETVKVRAAVRRLASTAPLLSHTTQQLFAAARRFPCCSRRSMLQVQTTS